MAAVAIPDVFVTGGGPAGLAVAIAARRKGMRVVVADALRPPIDKACGEGMLPDGLPAARLLGLDLSTVDRFPVRGIRFCDGKASVASDFPQGSGFGVRRTVLHQAMTDLAEQSGVELRWGQSVGNFSDLRARWIVGADGASSRLRCWAGLDRTSRNTRRFGFRQHFRIEPWSDYVEVHWGAGCQIYVTPVASNEVGIALISSKSKLRLAQALTQFPELRARINEAKPASTERGAVTSMRRLKRVTSGNLALVGDASGSVDAITGEGLCLSFHQALALADAMESGDLNLYESAHARLGRRPRMMANLLLTMDRWSGVRSTVSTETTVGLSFRF